MKAFLLKNRVLISALLSAVILVLQQALQSHAVSWKAVGFAALLAVLGVIGNQWKGKGISIAGIAGTLAFTFTSVYQSGNFTWNEFILSALLAIVMTVAGSLTPEPAP